MAECSDDILIKTMQEIVANWMSAKLTRQVGNSQIELAPKFIYLTHDDFTTKTISATNGALYSNEESPTSQICYETRVGDDINGTGYDFGAIASSIKANIRELKTLANENIGKSLNYSISDYFQSHSLISVQKKNDFKKMTPINPVISIASTELPKFDDEKLIALAEKYSKELKERRGIKSATVTYELQKRVSRFVSSEGTVILSAEWRPVFVVGLEIKDSDGRELDFADSYSTSTLEKIMSEKKLSEISERLYKRTIQRIDCPVQEAGRFDAIFDPLGIGILFHEIVAAHLLSAKYVLEDNLTTFDISKLGKQIMPEFISLYDDPLLRQAKDWNNFRYDDEGVPTQRKLLVENGILRGYLSDRSSAAKLSDIIKAPVYPGNSRRETDSTDAPEPRISNLEVITSEPKSFEDMKKALIKKCIKEDKDYGILFYGDNGSVHIDEEEETQGLNQHNPSFIYRIDTSGRITPVKCAHVIGVAYNMLNSVLMLGKNRTYLTGYCGADSGFIPAGELAMHGLLSNVEFVSEKKDLEQDLLLKTDDENDCDEDKE
ncbi:MAG: TldD/PmbA family protein [Candidatus Woesearchaeota archaeon]|nr:TldD/PmbA family protein [Candidatus Woesearchaeota archaeon]